MKCDSSCHIIEDRLRFCALHNKENVRRRHPSLCPSELFFINSGLLGGNSKFASKRRVSLQVGYSDPFLIVLGLREEMRIIRLRKGSVGWPAVPAAEEEHYVGLCCLQGTLVFPNT